MSAGGTIDCPMCGKAFSCAIITEHANSCLNETDRREKSSMSGMKRKSNESQLYGAKITKNSLPEMIFAKSSKKSKKEDICVEDSHTVNDDEKVNDVIFTDDVIEVSSESNSLANREMKSFTKERGVTCLSNELKPLNAPLADRVRPITLEDYVGQTTAVGKNRLLHSLLTKGNSIPSMILWGPPGCGKTTLAKILAQNCKRNGNIKFISLSATSASVNDVKELAKIAQNDVKMLRRKTILFLDEIHRFNKLQQDALLPHVENGLVTLIGATTENPSFHVNNALLSRCRVISLNKLEIDDVERIVKRACSKLGMRIKKTLKSTETEVCYTNDQESSECNEQEFYFESNNSQKPMVITIEDTAVEALSGLVDGDARAALNGLQMTVQAKIAAKGNEGDTEMVITLDNVKEGLQMSHILYDRNGEEHFNIASALIKSMRGSDDNAALYWLSRMMEGGEKPIFVARRLIAFASEDVGLADSTALNLAVSTFQACQLIGMPECAINLAHCVVYLCRAPKSVESYTAFRNAQQFVRNYQGPMPSVPLHLRNASTKLMKTMGCGAGYKYPPAYEGPVKQDYLPSSLIGTDFFSFMKNKRPRDHVDL